MSVDIVLQWMPRPGEIYDVFVWRSGDDPPTEPIVRDLSVAYYKPALGPGRYQWRVEAQDALGDFDAKPGPVWSFDTGECTDPVPGPPTVTSDDELYPPDTTSETYTLTFSEAVRGVADYLSWAPIRGTGTKDTVTEIDPETYVVGFSDVRWGDAYLLVALGLITDSVTSSSESAPKMWSLSETGCCAISWDMSPT